MSQRAGLEPRAASAFARRTGIGMALDFDVAVGGGGPAGAVAARSIAARFETPQRARRAYRTSLAREILPELRRARSLAALLYDHPRLRSALFGRLGPSLCEAMADVVAGEASYASLLRSPRRVLRAGLRLVAPRATRAVFRPEKP